MTAVIDCMLVVVVKPYPLTAGEVMCETDKPYSSLKNVIERFGVHTSV